MKKYITLVLMMMFFGTLNAHPLGIFSVNRYTRIELAGAKLRLVYVTDIAEISTIQEFARIDINHDGNADDQERRLYAESKMQEIMSGFVLTIDGKEIPVRATGCDISFPEGQGGLRTIRFSPTFEGYLPNGQVSHTLNFVDHNAEERMGWKEIVLHPMNGEKVERSSVSQTDVANELRNYPADRLTNPLQQLEATIQFTPGNTTGVSSVSSFTQSIIEKTKDGFAELISAKDLSVPVMMVSLLIAMMLGAGHALTPGHGKTIVAAYLVGQRGTAKHAAFLGLTVTATHTIGVFAMGLIALFASNYILPEHLFPWLGLLSGLIVVGIGMTLLRKRILVARGSAAHTHDGHTHTRGDGHHEHSHGGNTHSHLPPGTDGSPVTWKSLLALGVSGGLLPCPSAIVVLLSAISLGRIGFGLMLILSFSVGLAGVLTGIGMMMVYARKFFERFTTNGPLVRWLPVVSAFVVTLAGAIISVQALGQAGIPLSGNSFANFLSLNYMFAFNAGALSILGLGFVLGLKHALDADHLVAVSTIVSERKGFWSSSIVGALWGLGHTASLLIVGLAVIAFQFNIPEKVAMVMEFSVALMLVILGVNVLWKIRKGAVLHLHTHEHDHHLHIHPHLHEHEIAHQHNDSAIHHHKAKVGRKPFFVGMVHGMAGSAALMLVVLATISSRTLALMYIAIFGIGSVGGMFLMSALIGLPFTFTSKHERLNKIVSTTAGIISVVFGLFYAWQIGIADGLFL